MVLSYIKDALKEMKSSSKDKGQEMKPPSIIEREVMRLHREITKLIFPHEVEKMENAVRKVLQEVAKEISEYKERVISMLLRMLDEIQERGEEGLTSKAYSENIFIQPFFKTLEAMTLMHMEIASIFSSKSFMSAFLTISALDSKLRSRSDVNVEVEREEAFKIHSTWGKLAEKGICLTCRPEFMKFDAEEVRETLKKVGEMLSEAEKLNRMHEGMADYLEGKGASRLSHVAYNTLSSVVHDKEIKNLLSEYITNHLCALGEQLMKQAQQPSRIVKIEDIASYVNKVFVNGGFLEYEVYSALVRQGIAAVPRLRFSILELLSDNKGFYTQKRESYEVDVAATADSELWLIEVTTLKDEKDISNKVSRYKKLKNEIGADKVIFVGSPSTCELVEEAFMQSPPEDLFCVQFGKLYSEIFRLLGQGSKVKP
jgi:hypothetical protein